MRAALKAPRGGPIRGHRPSITAIVVGAFFLLPIGYLGWETFSLGSQLPGVLATDDIVGPLARSLLIATATALACGLIGTAVAWVVVRTDILGGGMLRWAMALPLVIPSFVGATALASAFGPGALIDWMPRIQGFTGALLVLTLLSYPYVYLPVVARLMTTSQELEEASRLLGASSWRTFRTVVVPQIRHSAWAGMLLVFLYALSDFGAVSLMRYDTVTRAIFSAGLGKPTRALTLGFVLALVALIVAWIERTTSRRAPPVQQGGRGQVVYGLGRLRILAFGGVGFVLFLGLIAPIAVFVTWIFRGSGAPGVGYSGWGDSLGFLVEPIANSALSAVVAAAVAAAVVLPVAYVAARRRGWHAAFASTSVASLFALPGLVVALAIAFWALQAPEWMLWLYQSFPLLILAYVLHFGAQAMTVTRSAVANVPVRYEEAGKMLGASRVRRFATIELPLIVPGMLAGAGLVLLSTLKELPATLLLAPLGFQTLATKIWGASEEGFFAEVGVTSLALIILSGVLTWTFVLRHQPRLKRPRSPAATID